MMQATLDQMATVLDGRCTAAATCTGASIDSRALERGNLFVAIRGERFDGHDFVAAAGDAGAAAAMVSRELPVSLPQLVVGDTRVALGQLAAWWRRRLSLPLVGVTGSNGKTTVKELLAGILARRGAVLSTRGNLNNDLGVPLTLLQLGSSHHAAVVEMGANHAGEIAHLATLAGPDVGVVTNAGRAHLEGFGSLAGVARAKGEMFSGLPADGTAIINRDDAFYALWRDLAGERTVVTFGVDAGADVRPAGDIETLPGGGSAFVLVAPAGEIRVTLSLPGLHNVRNALAAAAAALAAGTSLSDVAGGLEAATAPPGRLQVHSAPGLRVIDDTYNANPDSLGAALEVLMQQPGERWLVIGDMGELGESAGELHEAMGLQARHAGVARLYALGDLARRAAAGFGAGGSHFDSEAELLAALHADIHEDRTILVKGSRAMRMERVVKALLAPVTAAARGD